MAKPDDWSERLWEAYKFFGESDARYVASCNRFLGQMLEHQLHATAELVIDLRNVIVLTGGVVFSDRLAYKHQRGLPALAQEAMVKEGIRDEIGVYQRWYSKHIRWPETCVAGKEGVELERLYGLPSPETGQKQRVWRTYPTFLSACFQLARRSFEDPRLSTIDVYGSRTKEKDTLTFRPSEEMERYLTSSEWRVDDGPLDDLSEFLGQGLDVVRKPDEDRRGYLSRVLERVDDQLISAMYRATEVPLTPKVKLEGRPLDPSNAHEKMLVLRMFGTPIPDIVGACRDSLLDKKGRPLVELERTVRVRTNLIAEHLGFLPGSGDEGS